MQVVELIGFLDWFDKEVREPQIASKYSNLFNILSNNAQPSHPLQPFEGVRDILIDAVLNVNIQELSDSQARFC